MLCVMCESYAVQLRPAVNVLVVPYSMRLTLYGYICAFVGVLLKYVFEMLDMNSTVIQLTAQKALLHMDGMVCVVFKFYMFR